MATYYVDNVNGNDGNSGLSEVLAFQTIAAAISAASDYDHVYIQAGSNYGNTSSIVVDKKITIEGYTTAPGARDGRPIITSATDSIDLWVPHANTIQWVHLKMTHTASTRGTGIKPNASDGATSLDCSVRDCVFDGCLRAFDEYFGLNRLLVQSCEIANCTGSGACLFGNTNYTFDDCYFHGNTGANVEFNYGDTIALFRRNRFSGGTYGVYYSANAGFTAIQIWLERNTIYNPSSHGVYVKEATNGARISIVDNLFHNIGGYGVQCDTGTSLNDQRGSVRNNAFRSTTSGHWNGFSDGFNDITLSADALTDPGSGDFSPNNDAGGGADIRGAGTQGADVGAVQHQDGGGGGGGVMGSRIFTGF